MAATAMLNPVKEGRFILPGCDRRPADVYLPNWAAGRDATLDITVINPLQNATLEGAARDPGHAQVPRRWQGKLGGRKVNAPATPGPGSPSS